MRCDLLVVGGEVLTLAPGAKPRAGMLAQSLGAIEDGAVACSSGVVAAAGSREEVLRRVEVGSWTTVIEARGKVAMPGFVDAHTHLVFAGSREDEFAARIRGKSYMEIHREGGGILRTVRETRAASIWKLIEEAKPRLDRMLRHGSTTVEAKSGYCLDTEGEVKMLKAIRLLDAIHPADLVPTFLGAHAVPEGFSSSEYAKLVAEEMVKKAAELAEFCDVFCEKGVFSPEESKLILEAGLRQGLRPQMHIDEFSHTGGAKVAAELKAVVSHLTHTSKEELRMLAEAGCIGILLPATLLCTMQEEWPNASKYIEAGLPVALGSDMSPACWVESMQLVIQLACLMYRMAPEQAITAATVNAAHAVGRGLEVGSLEPWKKADIIVLDARSYEHIPYHIGTNLVETVIKGGKIVYEAG